MNLPRTGGATLDNPIQTGEPQQFLGNGRSPEFEIYPAATQAEYRIETTASATPSFFRVVAR